MQLNDFTYIYSMILHTFLSLFFFLGGGGGRGEGGVG